MVPISTYVPPVEPFVVWGGLFTSAECDAIREHGARQTFEDARIGGGQDGGVVSGEVRRTDLVWIRPAEETGFIFRRLSEICSYVNHDKFQLDLLQFDGFQYSLYKPDGHYDWHVDTQTAPADGLFRKLSLVVMLSDPSDYEGGDFLLCPNGNNDDAMRMRLNKGDLLAFYSHIAHKVEPVLSGDRVTLVTWAKGPKPR
jgi:PKHD-type hydroxylase